MFPKEHGAYGQLLFPLLTALAIGRPGVAALALSAAVACAFLAHEPLLVLIGQRGTRAAREMRGAATVWFGAFAALALVGLAVSLFTGSAAARVALAGPAALAIAAASIIVSGREHSAGGEIVSAIALSSAAYPIGVAASASARASLSCAAAFATAFVVGIVSVHSVIAFTRQRPAVRARLQAALTAVGAVALVYALARARVLEVITPIAVLPACLAAALLAAFPPSARRLRVVGWTLVSTSVLTAAALLAAFR